nr:SH3 domain-containing protein [Treponema sp.]
DNKYVDENTLISLYTNNLNYLKEKFPRQTIDEDLYYWIDHLNIQGGDLYISNVHIRIMDSFGCGNSGYFIQNIKEIDSNLYSINVVCSNFYHDDSLISINSGDEVLILLELDKDYIKIYLNDKTTLFKTYVKINEHTENEINNFAQGKEYDIKNIIWPRHADGSCDYDDSKTITTQTSKDVFSSNVAKNKIMTVTENLKLRSGEATSTQVLAVMAAGTKVKILELGKAEIIDDIPSNWVKVEVQADAKDRDGNPIKAGTVGWCYGGYLEETKQNDDKQTVKKDEKKKEKKMTDESKSVEEAVPAVKQSYSLPLVIIVASAVILLLCIVIILIVRKKTK